MRRGRAQFALFGECAGRAERIRQRGAEVVFVTGAELSLMNPGFLPGGTLDDRVGLLLTGSPGVGAADLGARALEVLEYDEAGAPVRLNGEYVRDEAGQARYVRELLEVFDAEGVDSAFVFAFALNGLVHRPDGGARDDLDLASYGIVAVLDGRTGATYPDLPWEPKAAFAAVAESYR